MGVWITAKNWKVHVQRPYWTELRGVGNSVPAQSAILIPLIGYWIIFNDRLLQYAALSTALDTRGHPPMPGHVSWRLFDTYFGLFFIAAGSLVYRLRCPSEVKLYPTASAYVGGIFPHISGIEMMRVEKALADGDDESRRAAQATQTSLEKWGPLLDGRVAQAHRDGAEKNNLQNHFDLCNRSAPIARIAAGATYAVGLLLLTVPAADILWRVTRALWRSL